MNITAAARKLAETFFGAENMSGKLIKEIGW
jgi:hypothetical protein